MLANADGRCRTRPLDRAISLRTRFYRLDNCCSHAAHMSELLGANQGATDGDGECSLSHSTF